MFFLKKLPTNKSQRLAYPSPLLYPPTPTPQIIISPSSRKYSGNLKKLIKLIYFPFCSLQVICFGLKSKRLLGKVYSEHLIQDCWIQYKIKFFPPFSYILMLVGLNSPNSRNSWYTWLFLPWNIYTYTYRGCQKNVYAF